MSTSRNNGIVVALLVSVVVGSLIGFGLSYAMFGRAYVSASLRDDRLSSSEQHTVKGTVINFGTVTASNIVITVKWYKLGASFHQETITIASLEGRAMKDISFSYVFGGGADDLQYTITWS